MAPSLGGGFAGNPRVAWGTPAYIKGRDVLNTTVFFGLYGLKDFYDLWRHSGKAYVLWAGSDIVHFENGYWLDSAGKIRIDKTAFARWLDLYCDNWCENDVEKERLALAGIEAKVCPSYLGDKNKIPVSYTWSSKPKIYASVSSNNFKLYAWNVIERIAGKCNAEFHLFGNSIGWQTKHDNVIVHGRIPKKTMTSMTRNMQCGFRPLEFDGFSEVLAESVLMGQYPISRIPYRYIDSYTNDEELIALVNSLSDSDHKKPNMVARKHYLKNINRFPWNQRL